MSLAGLTIQEAHALDPSEVAQRLEEFAQDMVNNKFADWGVQIEREEHTLTLRGRRDAGTHFEARVEPVTGEVKVLLTGAVELGRLKVTLAGGADGVRRRVGDEIARTLREHLT
ncbi:MAG: hypothetical protein KDD82_29655 [Planctomycetes bacterium]|nr:hypothetical protein [Planctomycetota bacterium]